LRRIRLVFLILDSENQAVGCSRNAARTAAQPAFSAAATLGDLRALCGSKKHIPCADNSSRRDAKIEQARIFLFTGAVESNSARRASLLRGQRVLLRGGLQSLDLDRMHIASGWKA
jgi:hypothetical protein